MPCQCALCTDTPGETYTEQFRHRTEVNEIMRRFETPESIKEFLKGVEEKRGTEAMQRLRLDLLREWKRK